MAPQIKQINSCVCCAVVVLSFSAAFGEVAPRGDTWGAQGNHFGGLGVSGGSPGGSLGLPGRSPGSSRGVPGCPGGVLGAALGGFGADWGEQPPKKWLLSNPITVLNQKRVPKGTPRGSIFGFKIYTKSHQDLNAILVTCFDIPDHHHQHTHTTTITTTTTPHTPS